MSGHLKNIVKKIISENQGSLTLDEIIISVKNLPEYQRTKIDSLKPTIKKVYQELKKDKEKCCEIVEFCLILFILHLIMSAKIKHTEYINDEDMEVIYGEACFVLDKLRENVMLKLLFNENYKNENDKNKNINDNNKIKKSIPPSRFKTDFTIIEKLGQGGEGAVFKVRNNWDKVLYAIKIIKLKINTKNEHDEITENLKKEVNFLSHYSKCPYIVRYYQTWMEDYNEKEFKDLFDDYDDVSSTRKRQSSFDDTSRSALKGNKKTGRKYSIASADDENSSNDYEDEENEAEEENKETKKDEGNHIWSESESESENSNKKIKPKKLATLNTKKNQYHHNLHNDEKDLLFLNRIYF